MALRGVWCAMSPVATDRCVATGLVVGPLVMITLFSPLIKGGAAVIMVRPGHTGCL